MIRKAYQTLENRGNADDIEKNGPFLCNRKDAWLGEGYYFWDSFIENAHWWGKKGACYQNGYIICESSFELNEKCLDLHDNPEHMKMFSSTIQLMEEKELFKENQTTIGRVIEFLKQTIQFDYEAIRANGVNSISQQSSFSKRTPFKLGKNHQYWDATPAIQICFIKKDGLNRKEFKIVYPLEYCQDYVV